LIIKKAFCEIFVEVSSSAIEIIFLREAFDISSYASALEQSRFQIRLV
jgi:hypothetical protein